MSQKIPVFLFPIFLEEIPAAGIFLGSTFPYEVFVLPLATVIGVPGFPLTPPLF
jgi:hypothetical protein